MKATDFCYWLQGYFELNGCAEGLTGTQAECVRQHLSLVFAHDIDPKAGDAEHQEKLNQIHGGTKGGMTPRC